MAESPGPAFDFDHIDRRTRKVNPALIAAITQRNAFLSRASSTKPGQHIQKRTREPKLLAICLRKML
jgi:hypothetical protein